MKENHEEFGNGKSEYLNYSMNYSDDINTILLTTPKCSYFYYVGANFRHKNTRISENTYTLQIWSGRKRENKEKSRKFIIDGHTLLNIISHNIIDNKNDVLELRV